VDIEAGHIVLLQVLHDERALRDDRLAAGSDVRHRGADEARREAASAVRRIDLRVRKDEATVLIGGELGEARDRAVHDDLVTLGPVVAHDLDLAVVPGVVSHAASLVAGASTLSRPAVRRTIAMSVGRAGPPGGELGGRLWGRLEE
jgi:hypothetical protein